MYSTEEYNHFPPPQRAKTLLIQMEAGHLYPVAFHISELKRERDPLVRWHLVKGLGIHRDTSGVGPLLSVLRQPDMEFASTSLHRIAAWSLGRIGSPALSQVLAAATASESQSERAGLADALGEIGDPSSIGSLAILFTSGDHCVRLWASLSLAKIGETGRETLYELLATCQSTPDSLLILDAINKLNRNSVSTYHARCP